MDMHVAVYQETEDVCMLAILINQRGVIGSAVCLLHVCANVIGVSMDDNKATAPCLCWFVWLDTCVLHILAPLEYRLSLTCVQTCRQMQ